MDLKKIFLFENLEEEDFKKILSFTKIVKLKKGDIVFYEKDESRYLHVLLEGMAKVYKVDAKGNELIIHKFHPVTLIAEMPTFEKIPFPANCAMETEGVVLKIDFEKFKDFLNKGQICLTIMSSLLKKLYHLDNIIQTNLILDTKTKIAKFIYENPELFEELKQHNVASLLNIKPETLSRKLKEFKELGIIENEGSRVKVKNRELIREYFTW